MIKNKKMFFALGILLVSGKLLGNIKKIDLLRRGVRDKKEISLAIENYCKIKNKNIVYSIIKVESDFRTSAINSKSSDYGLMQINNWHVRKSGLDRVRLLTDVKYNIEKGCEILYWFLSTYGIEEGVARYNCGTKRDCIKWKSVVGYKKKVLMYYNLLNNFSTKRD